MAKPEKEKGPAKPEKEKGPEETQPAPGSTQAPKPRGMVKKALALNIAFNIKKLHSIKAGKRLDVRSADYYLVTQSNPEKLKKISEAMYELTEDVTVMKKVTLPVGTILDDKEDAWIIERIRSKHAPEAGALKEIDVV
jgi:hypothetical protein